MRLQPRSLRHQREFASELPDIPETRPVLEKYLDMGAIGIGEGAEEVLLPLNAPAAANPPAVPPAATATKSRQDF